MLPLLLLHCPAPADANSCSCLQAHGPAKIQYTGGPRARAPRARKGECICIDALRLHPAPDPVHQFWSPDATRNKRYPDCHPAFYLQPHTGQDGRDLVNVHSPEAWHWSPPPRSPRTTSEGRAPTLPGRVRHKRMHAPVSWLRNRGDATPGSSLTHGPTVRPALARPRTLAVRHRGAPTCSHACQTHSTMDPLPNCCTLHADPRRLPCARKERKILSPCRFRALLSTAPIFRPQQRQTVGDPIWVLSLPMSPAHHRRTKKASSLMHIRFR